ncbi:MAG TPA: hypothetical protein DCE43_11910 [Planctomycetaceae bacterium]|nr:hypothetical protein [Planctomycetaceae bacterium]
MRRGAEAPDPDLQAAVEQMRKTFLTLFESAKRHNVRGLEHVPYKATYVPRFYDISAIYKALERDGGHENLVRLFTKALMNEHNKVEVDGALRVADDVEGELKLPEDRARRWAKGLVDVLLDQESYTDLERSHIVSGNAKQLVRTFLTSRVDDSGAPSFSPDDIKAIMNLLGQGTRKKGDEGTPLTAALDRRNELDETTSIDIGNGETLNLEQLLINDSRELVEVYAKQMTGAIGATELLSEMGQITGKTFTHPSDLMAYLRREMNKARIAPAKIDSDMEKITTMMNSLRGKRLHQGKTYDNFLRNIRLYNLFRVGGQFGIASLPEFGQIAGSVGFSAMLRQMPALRQVFKHGADGTLKNPLLQELQVFVATGLGWRNSEVLRRMDLGDATPEMDTGPKGIGSERARKASRIFNVMSGLTPVHIMQQRWAASLIAQKFADMAWGRKTMGPRRLAMLGLTPEMGEKIMKAMRHASREEGMFGIRLTKLNLDQWTGDEAEAASALIGAIGRFSSRVVQENDIGNLSKWMTTEIGKTILQFRTFPAVAYEKQFLSKGAMIADGFRGEREMAWHSVMEALSAMTIAGLAYHAQTTINSVGRKDREEYLKEALSTKKTIAVAWQRAGWSTFLPDAMDTAAYFGGADSNLFTGRTSGLNISSIRSFEGLLSNPSFDLMTKAGGSMRDLVKNLGKDNDFTRDEWRKFYGLLPFTRLTPLMILGDSLGGTLPEDN